MSVMKKGRIIMAEILKARVSKFETFGLVDGPGVRFVVFLQGCNLRCQFCHNPETWKCNEGGELWSLGDLYNKVIRYKPYWKDNGGVTVSGGEPLVQIDFLIEFFKKLKKDGVQTVIDTAGEPFTREEPFFSKFEELMKYTDLVMLDLKEMDEEKHIKLTGKTNQNIFDLANYLSDTGKEMWIRHVLVPGLTDDEEGLKKMKEFIDSLKTVTKVEILPYHTLALPKWDELGLKYPLEGVPTPTEEEVKKAEDILGIVK